MKLYTAYIVLVFSFFFSTAAFAQVDRSIAREQYKPAKKKNEKKDFVEQTVIYLTKELTLDGFQEAAVKNIIEEERDAITNLNTDKNMTMYERKDKARDISGRIYQKVLPLLSKTQAEKYTEMEEKKKL